MAIFSSFYIQLSEKHDLKHPCSLTNQHCGYYSDIYPLNSQILSPLGPFLVMSNEPQEVVEGTLSEATLAYQNDPLKLLTHDMITRLTKYVAGEIQASAEDYVLLEQLTLAAAGRYEDLSAKGQKMFELFAVRC